MSSLRKMLGATGMVNRLMNPGIPERLSRRFIHLDQTRMEGIEALLKKTLFSGQTGQNQVPYFSTSEGQLALHDHLTGRLHGFRHTVIPWLDDARSLAGAKILEIGCGTGSSTVALAEQGAEVTAVDIVEKSLFIAKERCSLYNLKVNFHCINATEVENKFRGSDFDFIIFFAALEHMTHKERLASMKSAWNLLSPGNFWCLIETPNRLWYYDFHTSFLPFYLWLPDELAFAYSQLSPRKDFSNCYRELNDDTLLDFLRRGRGLSYHEFELTLGRAEELDVVSSMSIFIRNHSLARKLLWCMKKESRFESLLLQCGPKIHRGFYQPNLDLIIRKK